MSWQDNFLACYPYVLDRLRQVRGISLVPLSEQVRAGSPKDGTLYVIFDGVYPKTATDNRREQLFEIGLSVVLVKKNIASLPNMTATGECLTNIIKALQGYRPKDNMGEYLTETAFNLASSLSPDYDDNFIYYPMRFVATVAIISQ